MNASIVKQGKVVVEPDGNAFLVFTSTSHASRLTHGSMRFNVGELHDQIPV